MLKKVVLALMLACGFSHAQTVTTGTTTTYQMGDDGYVNVPLPFKFPLYGQSFTNSWMYDNGIVSFLQPGTAGAISPWQWYAPGSLSQAPGKYFIAALWADIAPTNGTVYSTSSDGTYMKYNWNNISEYYSGGTRLNSFSTTITPDGQISTSYYSLNLQTSNVSSGVVGDPTKGEVYQTYSAPFGTVISNGSISDWTYKPYDPCVDNPLYSPTCAGFSDALAKITSSTVTSPSSTTSTTTTPTTTVTTTVVDDPVSPTVTVTSTTTVTSTATNTVSPTTGAVNVAPTVLAPTATTTTQKSSTTNNTSLGLSVVAKNQQREQAIVGLAVQNAIGSAESASVASQQEALSVASMAVSNSVASAIAATSQSQSNIGFKITPLNSMFGSSGSQSSELTGTNENSVAGYNNMLTDKTNPLNEYVEHKSLMNSQSASTGPSVNTTVGNNEIAGGVDITKMALAPIGYTDYLNLTLRDASFYAPKEVYKNQVNVDNARAFRTMANDRVHQQMVDQQYGR